MIKFRYSSIILYALVGIAALVSYGSIRNFMIWPPYQLIIISNLTVNLVASFLLIGASSPWLTKRLFPDAPRITLVGTAIVLGLIVVMIFKLFGVETRW